MDSNDLHNGNDDHLQYALERTAKQILSEDEKERPYAKYFFDKIPQPDPHHYQLMDTPCDPAQALYPEDMNDLLNPGDLAIETGWCNLPNGTGFIANRNIYSDITAEMIDWWFAWHPLDDLRYRIWYPPQHAGISVSPEHQIKLLDSSIPMQERNWGITHHAIEDTNNGMEQVDIHFMSPQSFGFDMTRWKSPDVETFAGGQGWSVPAGQADKARKSPSLMCHIFRQTDSGLEHRTRFWIGYHFVDGKPKSILPPGQAIPEKVIKGLAQHNVCEFTRFKTFLPRIYKEFGEKIITT
ncbi:DAPG hydrolase family protein [Vibrio salinus]|uniref:DAPG hydrolase family protein n=1 Tax=Vibrio salinus TaxID=2899784 RepID=UPI001E3FD281|nr:hypothetical protein [Vibrio salinus]MCE0495192.1 hypothetical protein [Vibrio salinus]